MSTQITLQTFVAGQWHDAAAVDFLNEPAGHLGASRLAYRDDYVFGFGEDGTGTVRGLPAVSVGAPVDMQWRRYKHWPPFLVDLLPQGHARKVLAETMNLPPDAPGTELPLLLRAAGSPIGNVRVKEAWEAECARIAAAPFSYPALHLTRDIFERSEMFLSVAADFAAIASGSSGVQGAWPKMLLTQTADNGQWLPDPLVADDNMAACGLAKWVGDRREESRLILASEAPYLELARTFGLRCGLPLIYINDILLIPRFDREIADGRVVRLGQESIVSAAGIAAFGHSGTHEEYLAVIKNCCDSPATEVTEYVLRDVLNLALGNPDNHGRNTALQKRPDGSIRLTPLFDFCPMVLDPTGIPRVTRWRCMLDAGGPARDLSPDWATVCEVAAEGVMDAAELRATLADHADVLRSLPDEARKLGVTSTVIERAMQRVPEIADALAGLGRKASYAAP